MASFQPREFTDEAKAEREVDKNKAKVKFWSEKGEEAATGSDGKKETMDQEKAL